MIRFTICFVAFFSFVAPSAAQNDEGVAFFERKIRPVLVQQCYKCHSTTAKEPKGGLLLDTREGIRRGGESGRSVVPKSIADSLIIEALRHEGLEMPPGKQLPATVIADFEKWIRMGAPDPREGKSVAIRRKIDFKQSRSFWAFQPIRQADVPKVKAASWPKSDIDRFVLAKLESKGLSPLSDAGLRTLVRRVYFDLIGLPPSPEQIQVFLYSAEKGRDRAVESLIDELLESPHFGERWGRHWLDVVRYGESTGMERNYTYPQAWRYRDYVISAFNSDMPFDRFVHEQIAGDLLIPGQSKDALRLLSATGMLAMGPKSLNERNVEKFKMDIVDEQIDVTSRAFFGLTASCARCHDHKFDPIPQSEYYALAGIFRSTDTYYGTSGGAGNRQAGMLIGVSKSGVKPVNVGGGNKQKAGNAKKQINNAKTRVKRLTAQIAKAKNANQKKKLETQLKRFEAQLARLKKQQPAEKPVEPKTSKEPVELLMAVQDSAKPANTQIRLRGEANDRGTTVPRGFLTIATLGDKPKFDGSKSGRLQYAKWLTSSANPLTARVAVNRVWQHLFGRGIVASVNNFGANGDRPTHPELLDWLASDFVKNGWSIKKTIRSIMLSRAYQLGSGTDAKAAAIDGENHLLWRSNHRRLEVEAIRDAILVASGKLDRSPGVKSIVTKVGNGDIGRNLDTSRFQTTDVKRSVYLPIVRGAVPEMLRVFDFPEPSIISGQRDQTTVPTQALFMMNNSFVTQQSSHLADRLFAEAGMGDDERLALAYQLTLGRDPSEQERLKCVDYLSEARAVLGGGSKDADTRTWASLAQALFASAEFRYIE